MEYTPHVVSAALRNQGLESEDQEFYLDLEAALKQLSWLNRTVLYLYQYDISPQQSVEILRLKDNPQRLFNKALRLVVDTLNGKKVPIKKGETGWIG